ncbi:MAG: protein kinase, partial [Arcobacteraceae bacterium]|nr:protein kinase [Arcobacteraceae bacterium]
GLSKIVNALFKDSDYEGFKILGGAEIPIKNTFRKFDGILVSPYGIVLLELKDWFGNINLNIGPGRNLMTTTYNKESKRETSPIDKMKEAMDSFSDWNIFKDIQLQEKRIGAVIFTHKDAVIKCIDSLNNNLDNVYKSGNILITKSGNFPKTLKQYWKKDISKGKKYKLSLEQINHICDNYISANNNIISDTSISIKNSKYFFSKNDKDVNLSTEYYSLYKGTDRRKNKPIWIKEYELTTISKGSLEEEASRIKREVDALQDLNKSHNIQDFKDEEQIGTKLYVILEYIDGLTLEDFLTTTDIQYSQKLKIIYKVAYILKELEEESIIHRALNPKNIIITQDNIPVLINFELCKLDFLPTLPPRGRRLLDSAYEAREVNSNASSDI